MTMMITIGSIDTHLSQSQIAPLLYKCKFIFAVTSHFSFFNLTGKVLVRKYVYPSPLDVTTSQPDKSFTTPLQCKAYHPCLAFKH